MSDENKKRPRYREGARYLGQKYNKELQWDKEVQKVKAEASGNPGPDKVACEAAQTSYSCGCESDIFVRRKPGCSICEEMKMPCLGPVTISIIAKFPCEHCRKKNEFSIRGYQV